MKLALLLCSATLLIGCAPSGHSSVYAPLAESARNPAEAERLSSLAAASTDPIEQERLLRQALSADLYCGSAHNNLGALLLARAELYEAANEFEWAKKLMPGHPSPRLNLALTLEHAGRTDEALDEYRAALDVYPNHIQTLQALTRLQIRCNRTQPDTHAMLKEVALRGDSQQWRQWARQQMTLAGTTPRSNN